MGTSSVSAVSFDFGETIATLDTALLAAKVATVGVRVTPESLEASLAHAWSSYDSAIQRGEGGHPWQLFMRTLLSASVSNAEPATDRLDDAVAFLWSEQPKQNLWRKPIPGMIELCAELSAKKIPFGILSNSEGRLVELIEEMGQTHLFTIVADSGRLGIEKPDPRIFAWISAALGYQAESIVHVGDSLAADVGGALAAGMKAIWFSSRSGSGRADVSRLDDARARICRDADEVRAALVGFGLAL